MKTHNKQHGFTLIEIMIAMTIALVLMAGVIGIMSSSKRTYAIQQDLARLQENARFAMEFITSDLRMAGYFGCAGKAGLPMTWMAATDGDGANSSDGFSVAYLDANPGAFAVEHLEGQTPDQTPLKNTATSFTATTLGAIAVGDTVVASDCGGAEARTVATVASGGVITLNGGTLTRTYNNARQSNGASMRPLTTNTYSIDLADWSDPPNGSRVDPEDGFSLFRNGTELIQGIEKMEIRYGEDIDNDRVPDQYRPANAVTDWNNVLSARVTLLMQTIEQRYDRDLDTRTYDLGEPTAYNPTDDRRRRRVFSTVVKLRNTM